jgi:hypothetical protein
MLQTWSKKRFGNIIRELGSELELLKVNNADQAAIHRGTDHMQELLQNATSQPRSRAPHESTTKSPE